MTHAITVYLPWLLSLITAYTQILAGNKRAGAWLVGLANQLLWLVFILVTHTYGLVLMNAVMWVIYTRNYWKWTHEAVVS